MLFIKWYFYTKTRGIFMIKHLKNLIESKTDFSAYLTSGKAIEISFSDKTQSVKLDDNVLSVKELGETTLININNIEKITYTV